MPTESSVPTLLRVHLTNVAGAGASQLLLSLLPALERCPGVCVTEIHLPDRGPLATYQSSSPLTKVFRIRRILPNALSRVLECLWSSRTLSASAPLLVLGDLPLRCKAPQTVFVQNAHILKPERQGWSISGFKFAVIRWIFRLNARYANAFIVQTDWMREALTLSYPHIADKIHVVAQPVPQWMLGAPVVQRPSVEEKLSLIYPSAGYPHKNHQLLAAIRPYEAQHWPVESLVLTLPPPRNPAKDVPWIECVGFLEPAEMIAAYQQSHAMVFLSTKESLGFPLIEAMYLGLPVICADLPYAHALCSDQAIYFDPASIDSLRNAINELHARLRSGWVPDWSIQLQKFPESWNDVATAMAKIVRTTTINNCI
jgi:glycosyltransferase involved in cell wall biosynthesis